MDSSYKIENNGVKLWINSEIYGKDVILQTTYVLLDDYYFLIDKEGSYFIVYISPKSEDFSKENLEGSVYTFLDELIESSSYIDQLKKTSNLREKILDRALMTQTYSEFDEEKNENNS